MRIALCNEVIAPMPFPAQCEYAAKLGLTGRSDTWSTGHLLLLGVLIAIFAPLGDLTESMFKRNLDVKDFGALVSGHGGVLDRFDAFLFVLPVTYYVTLVLEPWT